MTGPEGRAEYKQVTVLFADVVRSMDLAAAVDLERLREVMTELVERSAAVVQRLGGTVEYTGDGVMALFGAPVGLEDHAFRACIAALAIQEEAYRLADEVRRRDNVDLRLRVGLNSGQVIAGQTGPSSLGYRATGQTIALAQRMESVAPPRGVLLSESTARLVEHLTVLAEPEWLRVKGVDEPVCTRRLIAVKSPRGVPERAEASLFGRRWEMAALDALVDRTISGRGGVVTVVGPPGIGKSRAAREVASQAAARGAEVYWTFCESHARDVPFYAIARLLRAGTGVADIEGEAARTRLRVGMPADTDPQDLVLLDDLLGIADPNVPLPEIDPDARRRRLTALINTASLARAEPALFIIEDAHWIDAVSESMLADFLAVIPRTPLMVVITARPEYEGALVQLRGAQAIALAPLGDSEIAAMLAELLGSDHSVRDLAAIIAERAAGNPFFAEEMVLELVQRGALTGERGGYVCGTDVTKLDVPATVQAAIEARIDRLASPAKRTLTAASVIGARFDAELLVALGIEPAFDELLSTEMIDQVRFTPIAEYAFRHPLICAVAYESQLKSDRAEWHRCLAAAIQERDPGSVDENAALIAEHLQAAGDLQASYGWHMRAAASATNRDLDASRVSWERACGIADTLPVDDPHRLPMRIAPRTMLCATEFQGRGLHATPGRFAELQELCNATGDKVSLAVGMTAPLTELLYGGRLREASRVATEQMALLDSARDGSPMMVLAILACAVWFENGDIDEMFRCSQKVIELAEGDAAKGADFGIGSPLAVAVGWRGVARYWLGLPGWQQDLDDAVAMARRGDPSTMAGTSLWAYGYATYYGVRQADDAMVAVMVEAVQTAEASTNDVALSLAKFGLGGALLCRDSTADRQRGVELMVEVRDMWLRRQVALQDVPVTEMWVARENARRGDRDAAIPVMRRIGEDLRRAGQLSYDIWATGVLVETLLERGADDDVTEAQEMIERLANPRAEQISAVRDITILRLRTLVVRARGDDVGYRDLVSRYREMAESLGFEGHIAWAEALTAGE